MIRNLVLMISTAAVLVLLFVGYRAVTEIERPDAFDARRSMRELSDVQAAADEQSVSFTVGQERGAVQPGGVVAWTEYDETTGRPLGRYRLKEWRKVPGTRNTVEVSEPVLTRFLADGSMLTVSADRGRLEAEGLENERIRPKRGWLEGNTRITIARPIDQSGDSGLHVAASRAGREGADLASSRPATSQPAGEQITIRLERIDFDIDRGELRTEQTIAVRSPEFELQGRGLRLIWNQADNRIETLRIASADQLVLHLESGTADALGLGRERGEGSKEQGAGSGEQGAGSREQQAERRKQKPVERLVTTYGCTLSGGVEARQFRGEKAIASLNADSLRLVFDIDSSAGRRLTGAEESRTWTPRSEVIEAATSAPAGEATTQPARDESSEKPAERLVVRWGGPLEVIPLDTRLTAEPAQRRIEAIGDVVEITTPDGAIRCGRLVYQEDQKRLWLYPLAAGHVDLALRDRLDATAASIYLDQRAHVIKLIGPVRLDTRQGRDGDALRIASDLWAELRLAENEREEGRRDEIVGGDMYAQLDSALFVGEVRVRISDRTLRANRLETFFQGTGSREQGAGSEEQGAGSREQRAKSGAQREATPPLVRGSPLGLRRERTQETRSNFENRDSGRRNLQLERAVASGDVRLFRERQRLECAWAQIDFAASGDGESTPEHLHALGAVLLEDADERVRARGRELTADFTSDNLLRRADVLGSGGRPAYVYAREYRVLGEKIRFDLDQPLDRRRERRDADFRMRVPGRAWLSFPSNRTLRGQRRTDPIPIRVTCDEMLDVDARRGENAIRLAGNVTARSAQERLEADAMTLLLEEVRSQRERSGLAGPASGMLLSPLPTERVVRMLLGGVVLVRRVPEMARHVFAAVQSGRMPDLASLGSESRFETRIRKEPFRLIAHNAAVISEEFAPGDARPVVSQTLVAPELVVEIRDRTIRTIGETTLGMTSRRMPTEQPRPRDTLGMPSALISRGPSLTALGCQETMTYIIGDEEGAERRDSVLFLGDVKFLHLAGQKIPNLEELLPQLRSNPDLAARLEDRHAFMECRRLELMLTLNESGAARRTSSADASRGMQLTWLNATGDVRLEDRQGAGNRMIYAEQIDFDRPAARVRVFGDRERNLPARVLYENKATGRFDKPAIGMSFTVFLDTNTIRADEMTGEFHP